MPRLRKNNKQKQLNEEPAEEVKEEIFGVNVLQPSEAPLPIKKKKEEKKANEVVVEEQPEGKGRGRPKGPVKKPTSLRDDGVFNPFIFRVIKETCPETSISKKAMNTVNQIVADKFDEILREARQLILTNKKSTLSSKEVETAIKLLIPGELGKHAVQEGRRALRNFASETN